jgi:predicted metal-dependent phosphotriesterase family hydrolase
MKENLMTAQIEKVPVEKLTKVYLKIKQKRSELSAEFKEHDDKLAYQQDKIKKALLDYCKEQGVESVRTSEGMFYRTTRQRYWTSDWDSMYKFVLEHNVPEFFDKRLNQTNVKQFLEENPELAPMGLQVDSEYVISVRKK